MYVCVSLNLKVFLSFSITLTLYIHICVCVCVCVVHIRQYIHISAKETHTHTHTHTHIYIYIYMCVCVCACVKLIYLRLTDYHSPLVDVSQWKTALVAVEWNLLQLSILDQFYFVNFALNNQVFIFIRSCHYRYSSSLFCQHLRQLLTPFQTNIAYFLALR